MNDSSNFSENMPSNNWAVLIGIEYYDHPGFEAKTPRLDVRGNLIGFKPLGGCVNDVIAIEKYLTDNVAVPPHNITKLLRPRPGLNNIPAEATYGEPTYEAIVNSLKNLGNGKEKPQNGDFVYIHYSGHGARTTTIFADLKKETDDIDEALVPCDITMGGKYLRDYELGALLENLVVKGLVVTLVLDCCHSGGALRGYTDDESKTGLTRGIEDIYISDPVSDKCQEMELIQKLAANLKDGPKGYVTLTACQNNEWAKETTSVPSHGLLTAQLLRSLRECPADTTSQLLFNMIRGRVRNINCLQTPDLLGDNGRFFFGKQLRRTTYTVRVAKEVDMYPQEADRRVHLDAGKIHGVRKGYGYAIVRLGFDTRRRPAKTDILAKITVETIKDDFCIAKFRKIRHETRRWEEIVTGCPAILNKLEGDDELKVRFESQGRYLRDKFQSLWKMNLGDNIWLRLVDNEDLKAHFIVSIEESNETFTISDPFQLIKPAMKLTSLSAVDMETTMPTLILRLEHLARFTITANLDIFSNKASRIATSIKCTVSCIPRDKAREKIEDEGRHRASDVPYSEHGSTWTVQEGDSVQMTFQNIGEKDLYIVVLSWNPELSISKLFPRHKAFEAIGKGKTKSVGFEPHIVDELKTVVTEDGEIFDVHKVFVSEKPMDLTSLLLDSLKKRELDRELELKSMGKKRGSYGVGKAWENLDDLLGALDVKRDQNVTYTSEEEPEPTWGMVDVRVRICPKSNDDIVEREEEEEDPEPHRPF